MSLSSRTIVIWSACVVVVCVLAANAVLQIRDDADLPAGTRVEQQLRDGAAPTSKRLSACTTHPCMEAWYTRLAAVEGADPAIVRLDATMAAGKLGPADCHGVMHAIGIGSLEHVDGNAAQAMAVGNPNCASGYYHGVLGKAFEGRDLKELPDYAAGLCAGPKFTTSSGPIEQCAHGIGHGFMGFTGYDLPGALATCDRLDDHLVDFCAGGALMDNWSSLGTSRQSKWVREDDVLYPCQVVGLRHESTCYSQLVGRMRTTNATWPEISVACARLPTSAYVSRCFDSLGANAQSSTRNDPIQIAAACAATEPHGGASDCVHGAAAAMIGFDGSVATVRELCVTVRPSERDDCARGLGRDLANLPYDLGPARGCRLLEPRDRATCLASARNACARRWASGAGCTAAQLGRTRAVRA